MSNHVALERMTTLAMLLEAEGLNLNRIREILRFVDGTGLGKHLVIPRDAVLRAPLMRPRKIVALGLNYVLHVKEGSFDLPKEPILFVKVGSSVVGPGEAVRIPRNLGRMDHEVELAVVIGKRATEVAKKDAYDYVAGYTIINDVSARSLQTKDLEKRHPWFRTKSFDTFTPMGPWMVTADEIRPPVRLNLECRVNGSLRQKANTRDLLFDIPSVIAFITRYITLDPGDVISTGTPAGIGPIRGGDSMTCTIQKIGKLTNPVRYR
jgi:2-keto-4-pentenoate hydratase/2-oxohepta-3-ene-1,7-dioic acid hydratase in catechol pathway